jgi:DNA polymerase-1
MSKKLLIDGDILIYKVATTGEVATNWGNDMWTLHCDQKKCEAQVDLEIDDLGANLGADDYIVCLTDKDNFRKDVLPSYKDNRKSKRKPMVLNALREYVMKKHNGVVWKNLEADDVMGILATEPTDEERIIVSIDKDMKTIPSKLSADGVTVNEIPLKTADYHHMIQTLTGDKVDNYDGIEGVGIKTAEKLIGQYTNLNIKDLWKIVEGLYIKKGYTKSEALQQARVAHICRHGDYNKQTGEVKLWTI